jgi:hypothetical protein
MVQEEVMTTRRAQTVHTRRPVGAALAVLGALVSGLTAAQPALGSPAPSPDASVLQITLEPNQKAPEVQMVQEFNTAWNAGDLAGVVAAFADNAQILQTRAHVNFYGPTVEVDDVYGTGLSFVGESPPTDGDQITWARGKGEIAAWVAPFLAAGHQPIAAGYRLTGQTVTWDYQVSPALGTRAYLPGVPPSEGTAAAQVTNGTIVALTLESAPHTAAKRQTATDRAASAAAAAAAAQAAVDASGLLAQLPRTQERATASLAPGLVAALICFTGAACLAALPKAGAN